MAETSKREKREGNEEPIFESKPVSIVDIKKPDFTGEPFRGLGEFIRNYDQVYYQDEDTDVIYEEKVPGKDNLVEKRKELKINFDPIKPFEARYVVYEFVPRREIIEKKKAEGWRTPSLEEAILFVVKNKKFDLLICLDEKRNKQFWIDARPMRSSWSGTKDYTIAEPNYRDGVDLDEEAVSDEQLLFVRDIKPNKKKSKSKK